jgi:hypothetical protein
LWLVQAGGLAVASSVSLVVLEDIIIVELSILAF